jgi:hypothetical protein
MRLLLLLCALSMPVVAWFAQRGMFGPTNGELSDRYPTLLVAAGWAFSVWGLIFLFDIVFGVWQARPRQRDDAVLARIRPVAAAGFVLTAVWMPIFSQQLFWLSLLVIWAALACLLSCALLLSREPPTRPGLGAWAWMPLSLHAGWLSLAAFLNTAQVIVAYRLLPTERMLGWSAALFACAAALLLVANLRMRGNVVYAAVALWGLAAVYAAQAASPLAGSTAAAWIAVVVAALLAVQTLWLRLRD